MNGNQSDTSLMVTLEEKKGKKIFISRIHELETENVQSLGYFSVEQVLLKCFSLSGVRMTALFPK